MLNESARRALDALLEGNRRFREGAAVHPRRDGARRAETAPGQQPFAAIVACADSRVPPEILFDQGIGDIFVVRTAGNVLDAIGLGSLEYAVEHLDVPLIVVLGHTHCGAIEAALSGGEAGGNVRAVIEALTPALEQSRGAPGDPADAAVRANVARTAALIARSQRLIGRPSARGSAAVITALYNIETGAVELLA